MKEIKSIDIGYNYELHIDNTYQYKIAHPHDSSKLRVEKGYFALDIDKIKSNYIELIIYLKNKNGRKYLFSNTYNLSDKNYINNIGTDATSFYNGFLEKEGLPGGEKWVYLILY